MDTTRRIVARPDVTFAAAARIVQKGGHPSASALPGLLTLAGPRWDWLSFPGWQFLCGKSRLCLVLIAERPSGAKDA